VFQDTRVCHGSFGESCQMAKHRCLEALAAILLCLMCIGRRHVSGGESSLTLRQETTGSTNEGTTGLICCCTENYVCGGGADSQHHLLDTKYPGQVHVVEGRCCRARKPGTLHDCGTFSTHFTKRITTNVSSFCPRLFSTPVLQAPEPIQLAVLIIAYPLFSVPLVGQFYHTAPILCSGEVPRSFKASGLRVQTVLAAANCAEFPYYSDSHGVVLHAPGNWSNDSLKKIAVVRVGDIRSSKSVEQTAGEIAGWGQQCRDSAHRWMDFNVGTYDMLNHNCNSWTLRVMQHFNLTAGVEAMKDFTLENAEINGATRASLDWKARMGGAWLAGFRADDFNGGKVTRTSERCQFELG